VNKSGESGQPGRMPRVMPKPLCLLRASPGDVDAPSMAEPRAAAPRGGAAARGGAPRGAAPDDAWEPYSDAICRAVHFGVRGDVSIGAAMESHAGTSQHISPERNVTQPEAMLLKTPESVHTETAAYGGVAGDARSSNMDSTKQPPLVVVLSTPESMRTVVACSLVPPPAGIQDQQQSIGDDNSPSTAFSCDLFGGEDIFVDQIASITGPQPGTSAPLAAVCTEAFFMADAGAPPTPPSPPPTPLPPSQPPTAQQRFQAVTVSLCGALLSIVPERCSRGTSEEDLGRTQPHACRCISRALHCGQCHCTAWHCPREDSAEFDESTAGDVAMARNVDPFTSELCYAPGQDHGFETQGDLATLRGREPPIGPRLAAVQEPVAPHLQAPAVNPRGVLGEVSMNCVGSGLGEKKPGSHLDSGLVCAGGSGDAENELPLDAASTPAASAFHEFRRFRL